MVVKKFPVFLLLMAFVVSACQDKGSHRAEVVSKLKSSAKLATVEYVVTKVISATEKHRLFKDTYFFAETEATIKAGIDLDKLREEDIVVDGKKINLTLPPIEIINFSYPAAGFQIVDKYTDESSRKRWNSINLKTRDELYRKGEEDIRRNIGNLGITKTAEKNTIMFLTPILRASGYDEIYIQFREDESLVQENKSLKDQVKKLEEELETKK